MGAKKRIRMIITGRVQGVCYRAYACDEGQRLKLKGWVRNVPNGSVELLAEGSSENLEALEAFCWQGSPFANVTRVESVEEAIIENELRLFEITY